MRFPNDFFAQMKGKSGMGESHELSTMEILVRQMIPLYDMHDLFVFHRTVRHDEFRSAFGVIIVMLVRLIISSYAVQGIGPNEGPREGSNKESREVPNMGPWQ